MVAPLPSCVYINFAGNTQITQFGAPAVRQQLDVIEQEQVDWKQMGPSSFFCLCTEVAIKVILKEKRKTTSKRLS